MSLLGDWGRWFSGMIRPRASTLASPSEWMYQMFSGGSSAAGVAVNADTAMMAPTVYACVNVIAQTLAALPLHIHRRLSDDGRELAIEHPLFSVLDDQPNDWQTAPEWRMWMVQSLLLRGNAYHYIVRDGVGRVVNIIPLETDRVHVEWLDNIRGSGIVYRYKGTTTTLNLLGPEVLHIRNMPDREGLCGLSVLSYQRDLIGESRAAQIYGAKQMANGSKLSGIVKVPHPIDGKVKKEIGDEWDRVYSGASNANKVAVLGAEADFKPISMTLSDAQYIESRKFTRADIAGIFRVPPVFIGDHENSTFSNNEQQDLHFSKHTITPWAVIIEKALKRDLLTRLEKRRFYLKFNMNALIRGDFGTRVDGYGKLIERGIYSPNEVRKLEDMPPREGGDVYLTPLNMREAGPDAQDISEPAEPDNDGSPNLRVISIVPQNAIRDAANRVVNRQVGAIKTGARSMRAGKGTDKVRSAVDDSAGYFSKVMAPLVGDSVAGTLAEDHAGRLKAALAGAQHVDDGASDALVALVEDWAPTEIERIVTDATAQQAA